MIAIVDSGSTKTNWLFTGEKEGIQIRTLGINPYYQTADDITEHLLKELVPNMPDVRQMEAVYFYGAGCELPAQQAIVQKAIQPIFPQSKIQVDNDLIAAARSLFGKEKGIACISGTGSNTCYYNGEKIERNINSLGLYMGDEGSGGYLGKMLIRDYLREVMPKEMRERFEVFTPDRRADIMDKIYRKPFPNRYLASLAPFAILHQTNDYVQQLILENFRLLFERCICQYTQHTKVPVRFIGSVALHLQPYLQEVAQSKGVQVDVITNDPLPGLQEYHLNHRI